MESAVSFRGKEKLPKAGPRNFERDEESRKESFFGLYQIAKENEGMKEYHYGGDRQKTQTYTYLSTNEKSLHLAVFGSVRVCHH